MHVSLKKVISSALVVALLVQTSFAQLPSMNSPHGDVWSDRVRLRLPSLKTVLPAPIPPLGAPTSSALSRLVASVSPYASVCETHYSRPSAPIVLVFQDIHSNLEAQQNIGQALLALSSQLSADSRKLRAESSFVIGVEAASGPFQFAPFRQLPDKKALKSIADAMLRDNRISAISWVGITAEKAPRVAGIDDPALYVKNVEAFAAAASLRSSARRALDEEASTLKKREGAALSDAARRLENHITAFDSGRVALADHVRHLGAFAPIALYPILSRFMTAVDMERRLDQTRAEAEREQIIRKLAATDPKATEELLALSASHQAGELDSPAFYSRFLKILDRAGVSIASAPHFSDYLSYASIADSLKPERIFADVQRMTSAAVNGVAKTPAEKKFFKESRRIHLSKKLVSFELTPDEWSEYRATGAVAYENFAEFYRLAELRNEKMAANLLRLTSGNKPSFALIVGGFHAPGVTRYLREAGASYAVLSPKITTIDPNGGSDYLDNFIRDRAPLTKLFAGEKLTVADANQLMGAPESTGAKLTSIPGVAVFTILLASFLTQMPNLTRSAKDAMIAAASGGKAALVKIWDSGARLTLSGRNTIDVAVNAKAAPAEQTIPNVEGLGNVSWKSSRASPPFQWLAGLLALGTAIGSALRLPKKDFGELTPEKVGAMSSEELWNLIKKDGYYPIYERLPYIAQSGSRVRYRLWNYLLSHSEEDLVRDFENMDGYSIASLLTNKFIIKSPNSRMAKPHKILNLLSKEKRAEVLAAMGTGEFRRMRLPLTARVRNIVYFASEFRGLFHTGGIGVVADSFPKTLWGFGHNVSQIIPYYEDLRTDKKDGIEEIISKNIKSGQWRVFDVPGTIDVPMEDKIVEATLLEIQRNDGPTLYLLRCPTYFGKATLGRDTMGNLNPYFPREGMDKTNGEAFALERYIFSSKANLLAMAHLGALGKIKAPEIVHINDWQTAPMAPMLLYLKKTSDVQFLKDREENPWMKGMTLSSFRKQKVFFQDTATVMTSHNAAYQGLFSEEVRYINTFEKLKDVSWALFKKLGLPVNPFFVPGGKFSMEYHGQLNFQLGIQSAEMSYTVSPEHAKELASGEYPYLPDVFKRLEWERRFTGIANGVDADRSPRTLPGIINYGATDVEEKKPINKIKLLETVGLATSDMEADKKRFLIGVVARMEKDKGFTQIVESIPAVLQKNPDVIFVVLGTGKEEYQDQLRALEKKFPKNVRAIIDFKPLLANLITVGSDSLLVPSEFEPSGLTHFDGMAVGTLPIVAPSGGLRVVIDASKGDETATGFVMRNKTAGALIQKINEAIELHAENPEIWVKMMKTAMNSDFTWPNSVDKIIDFYDKAEVVSKTWTGEYPPVSMPEWSTLVISLLHRAVSAFWSTVLRRSVFHTEDGLEEYATRWYGAPLHEAFFLILPLMAFFTWALSHVPMVADLGAWAPLYAAALITMTLFYASHYVLMPAAQAQISNPTRAGPWFLHYRGLGTVFIFIPSLILLIPAAMFPDRILTAMTVLFATLFTVLPHTSWNILSPRPLSTPLSDSEGALPSILSPQLEMLLLNYLHPHAAHGFRYSKEDIAFLKTDPGVIVPVPAMAAPGKAGKLSSFLTGDPEKDRDFIVHAMPPLSQEGEVDFADFYQMIYEDIYPPKPLPERMTAQRPALKNLVNDPTQVVDMTRRTFAERVAGRRRFHDEYLRRGKIAYYFTAAGAGRRFFGNGVEVSDKAMTKGNVPILDTPLGGKEGFKTPIEIQLLWLKELLGGNGEKPIQVSINAKDTSESYLEDDVKTSPYLPDNDRDMDVDIVIGHSIPMVRKAPQGGVAYIPAEKLELPAGSSDVLWDNTPGAGVAILAAAVSGRFLKWIDGGVEFVFMPAAEDLGAGLTIDEIEALKNANAAGMFLLGKRDIAYTFLLNDGTKRKVHVRGGEEVLKIEGPNNDAAEVQVHKDFQGKIVLQDINGVMAPILVMGEDNTKADGKLEKVEFEKGGTPLVAAYADGTWHLAIRDDHQIAHLPNADQIRSKTPIYNTNQFIFRPLMLLQALGFNDLEEYRAMTLRERRLRIRDTMRERVPPSKDKQPLYEGSGEEAILFGYTLSDVLRLPGIRAMFGIIDREAKNTDYGFAAFKEPANIHDDVKIIGPFQRSHGNVPYNYPPRGFGTKTAAAMKFVVGRLNRGDVFWPRNLWAHEVKDRDGNIVRDPYPVAKIVFDREQILAANSGQNPNKFLRDMVQRAFKTLYTAGYEMVVKKNFPEQADNFGIVTEPDRVTIHIHPLVEGGVPVQPSMDLHDLAVVLESQTKAQVFEIKERPDQVTLPAPPDRRIDPKSEEVVRIRREEIGKKKSVSADDIGRTMTYLANADLSPKINYSISLVSPIEGSLEAKIQVNLINPLLADLKMAGLDKKMAWKEHLSLRIGSYVHNEGPKKPTSDKFKSAKERSMQILQNKIVPPMPVRGLYFDADMSLRLNIGRWLGETDGWEIIRAEMGISGERGLIPRTNGLTLFRIVKTLNEEEFARLLGIVKKYEDMNFGKFAPQSILLLETRDWRALPEGGAVSFRVNDKGEVGPGEDIFFDPSPPSTSIPLVRPYRWAFITEEIVRNFTLSAAIRLVLMLPNYEFLTVPLVIVILLISSIWFGLKHKKIIFNTEHGYTEMDASLSSRFFLMVMGLLFSVPVMGLTIFMADAGTMGFFAQLIPFYAWILASVTHLIYSLFIHFFGDRLRRNKIYLPYASMRSITIRESDAFNTLAAPPMKEIGLARVTNMTPISLFTTDPVPADGANLAARAAVLPAYALTVQPRINDRVRFLIDQLYQAAPDTEKMEGTLKELAALIGVKNALGVNAAMTGPSMAERQAQTLAGLAEKANLDKKYTTDFFLKIIAEATESSPMVAAEPLIATDLKTKRDDIALYSYANLRASGDDSAGVAKALSDIKEFTQLRRSDNFGGVFISVPDDQKEEAKAWFQRLAPGVDVNKDLEFVDQSVADPRLARQAIEARSRRVNKMHVFPIGKDALDSYWNLDGLTPEEMALYVIVLITFDGTPFSLDAHFRQAEKNIRLAMEAA